MHHPAFTWKRSDRIESLNLTRDGLTLPVEVSIRTISLGGEPRVIACVRDITERKQVERSQRLLAEAELVEEAAMAEAAELLVGEAKISTAQSPSRSSTPSSSRVQP